MHTAASIITLAKQSKGARAGPSDAPPGADYASTAGSEAWLIRSGAGRVAAVVLGVLVLAGCARPHVSPILPPPYRAQIAARYDATWQSLIRALARENFPLRAVARDSGVIATDEIVTPIGLYADCGRYGDVGVEGEALVSFTVFAQANGEDTEVQINSKMRTQAHRKGDSGKLKPNPVLQCASTGRFEANLVDAVRAGVRH
jgi:hypothetical protein